YPHQIRLPRSFLDSGSDGVAHRPERFFIESGLSLGNCKHPEEQPKPNACTRCNVVRYTFAHCRYSLHHSAFVQHDPSIEHFASSRIEGEMLVRNQRSECVRMQPHSGWVAQVNRKQCCEVLGER